MRCCKCVMKSFCNYFIVEQPKTRHVNGDGHKHGSMKVPADPCLDGSLHPLSAINSLC